MSTTRATPVRLATILGVSLVLAAGIIVVGFAVAPRPSGAATPAASDIVADPQGPACLGRLATTERSLTRTIEALRRAAGADQHGRCAAYRSHVQVLVSARDTYATCMTGFARQDTVGQMDLAASNWRATIAERCDH